MAYLDIITLDQSKNYLKIDDTLTEDDANITRMIKASLSKFEKLTNVILYARDKVYQLENDCVLVYDYPINTIPRNAVQTKKTTYSIIELDAEEITLNVGYANVSDIPKEYIETALEMIDIMYYEKESGKKSELSSLSLETIANAKRFLI